MLSDPDRRALDEIEYQVTHDDPGFAWQFDTPPTHLKVLARLDRANLWTPVTRLLLGVLAFFGALLCLVLDEISAAATAAVVLVIAMRPRWPVHT